MISESLNFTLQDTARIQVRIQYVTKCFVNMLTKNAKSTGMKLKISFNQFKGRNAFTIILLNRALARLSAVE